jgi:hypothetical protein
MYKYHSDIERFINTYAKISTYSVLNIQAIRKLFKLKFVWYLKLLERDSSNE